MRRLAFFLSSSCLIFFKLVFVSENSPSPLLGRLSKVCQINAGLKLPKRVCFTRMQSNGTAQLIFGPLPQSTYEAATPITVDTTNHHHIPHQRPQSNGTSAAGSYNGNHRSSIRWNQAGISTSAERRLPFVHRFRGLPPPAGPPTLPQNQVQANKAKSGKMSTYETNPVGALQERFQSRGISPTYQIIQAEGASHCPTFTYQVFLADLVAWGSGSSKKLAKQAAARAMLDLLDGKKRTQSLFGASSSSPTAPVSIAVAAQVACSQVSAAEAGLVTTNADAASKVSVAKEEPVVGNPVGQLQEFCVKHGLPMPVYDLGAVEGQPHQVRHYLSKLYHELWLQSNKLQFAQHRF